MISLHHSYSIHKHSAQLKPHTHHHKDGTGYFYPPYGDCPYQSFIELFFLLYRLIWSHQQTEINAGNIVITQIHDMTWDFPVLMQYKEARCKVLECSLCRYPAPQPMHTWTWYLHGNRFCCVLWVILCEPKEKGHSREMGSKTIVWMTYFHWILLPLCWNGCILSSLTISTTNTVYIK